MPTFQFMQQIFIAAFFVHLVRYLIFAGAAFLLFYVWFRKQAIRRKIQTAFAGRNDIQREMLYSLSSFAVFALTGVLTYTMFSTGWNQLYLSVNAYGWAYLIISIIALIFIHDTWFYWTHRMMHHKRLFPIMHKVHHLSHNPTPWASFSFHPLEAFVQAMIFPLAVMLIPIHPLAALIWLLYMTVMNVLGHLGFEVLPAGFVRHWLFRWHNTSVHHNMHHSRVNCNYGLYFNIWDRLMGTNHSNYEAEYDRVTHTESRELNTVWTTEKETGTNV